MIVLLAFIFIAGCGQAEIPIDQHYQFIPLNSEQQMLDVDIYENGNAQISEPE